MDGGRISPDVFQRNQQSCLAVCPKAWPCKETWKIVLYLFIEGSGAVEIWKSIKENLRNQQG